MAEQVHDSESCVSEQSHTKSITSTDNDAGKQTPATNNQDSRSPTPVKESKTGNKQLIKSSSRKSPTSVGTESSPRHEAGPRKDGDGSSSLSSKASVTSLTHDDVKRVTSPTISSPAQQRSPDGSVQPTVLSADPSITPLTSKREDSVLSTRREKSASVTGDREMSPRRTMKSATDDGDDDVTVRSVSGRTSRQPSRVHFSTSFSVMEDNLARSPSVATTVGTSVDSEESETDEENRRLSAQQRKKKLQSQSRLEALMKKRREKDITDMKTTPNTVSMLDVRLRALDFMISRTFREEMLMAKQEIHPRRFQRNQKLLNRFQAKQDVLVLQEILVRLRTARERRDVERAKAAKQGQPPPSPGLRVTPEGESSDELSDIAMTKTIKPSTDNPELPQVEISGIENGDDREIRADSVKLLEGGSCSEIQAVHLALPSPYSEARSDGASTGLDFDDQGSSSALMCLPEVDKRIDWLKNKAALQSHSESCLGEKSCGSTRNKKMWRKAFVLIAKQQRAIRRMSYLRQYAPTMLDYIHKAAKNPPLVPPIENANGRVFEPQKETLNSITRENSVCSPSLDRDKRRPSSAIVSIPRQRHEFEELCHRYSRHLGDAAARCPSRSSFLPSISVTPRASPVATPSPEPVTLPPLSTPSQCNNGQYAPHPPVSHPRKAQTPRSVSDSRAAAVSRDFVLKDVSSSKLSDRMKERIEDITRIYGSMWISKMRQNIQDRLKIVEADRSSP